ncbi:MAG TPA: PepSY domain-containing protein, partial [Pseudoxanthomonas sp.]
MTTVRPRHRLLALAALAALAALSGAVFAQAPAPTAGKDALKEPQVRALLTEKGYTHIDDLDFEDGMWETDATSANGDRVDVRINPATGEVMAEKLVSDLSEN